MSGIKAWARSLVILAVFSSGALFLVPKGVQKQAKFVLEMLLLLCAIVPVVWIVPGLGIAEKAWSASTQVSGDNFGVRQFFAKEMEAQVRETAKKLGMNASVTAQVASDLRLVSLTLTVDSVQDDETLHALKHSLATYMGISEDKIVFLVSGE